ncbi:MAG: CvpA family protein [Paludibacteraceae bacterium]|nr:CvpA family protein [Paludibacteraceae bacterium]
MLDIIILLPLVYGLARGIMRGFFKEIVAVFGLLIAFVFAKLFADDLAPAVQSWFTWETDLSRTVAFLIIFFAVTIVLNLIAWLMTKLLKAINLGWLDRMGGAFVGLFKWAFIVSIIINCVEFLDSHFHIIEPSVKAESYTYKPVEKIASVFLAAWDKATDD